MHKNLHFKIGSPTLGGHHVSIILVYPAQSLCCKYGNLHTGQYLYEHHVYIDCATDITHGATCIWRPEKRGLRECDRLRHVQVKTNEEREAGCTLITL